MMNKAPGLLAMDEMCERLSVSLSWLPLNKHYTTSAAWWQKDEKSKYSHIYQRAQALAADRNTTTVLRGSEEKYKRMIRLQTGCPLISRAEWYQVMRLDSWAVTNLVYVNGLYSQTAVVPTI